MKPELDSQERQDCIDALRLQADAGPAVEDSWQHRYRVLADKLTKSDKDVPR